MVLSTLKRCLPISLALLLYYGSASRFTHGATSTAAFYSYQNERRPDDDSTEARIIPVFDFIIATAMLRPGMSRAIATCFVAATLSGLTVQRVVSGLTYRWDLVQAIWAGATAVVGFL
ncbi:hypothetical protein BGZ63DRAFT_409395 [Mariannaea sp. PMI_226]|nr:hypothetical protein BGZ63DRAFT_409395 [Mariannaea sp. PMI_226]